MSRPPGDVTLLLREAAGGSQDAIRELMPLVYSELRALAGHYMKGERNASTLQPTALVNEAFVRLLQGGQVEVEGRSHFFALAARAMRHVLVDAARERGAERRGGEAVHVTLDDRVASASSVDADVLAVHEVLEQLAALHERQARVVEMRYFGGMTIPEIAGILGVSTVTIDNDWSAARAWLHRRLKAR